MDISTATRTLAGLAQETRLQILRLLVRTGPRGLPVGRIAETLDLPRATLSFHLKEMRSAGLVVCERAGRSRIYKPNFESIQALLSFLSQDCCRGLETTREADASPVN